MNPLLDIVGLDEWEPLSRSRKPSALFTELGPEQAERMHEEFARWLLALLRAQVQACISNQRFPTQYEPLSPAWASHKEQTGLHGGFWRATGVLSESLSVWKERGAKVWHLGWKPGQLHPENGEPIAEIAQVLEMGAPSRNLPARPLFTLLAKRMKQNVYRLFYVFCREKHPKRLPLLPKP